MPLDPKILRNAKPEQILKALQYIKAEKARQASTLNIDQIQDPNIPQQNAFVLDKSRYVSALCTRRAGKSTGLSMRFIRTMLKYPGCFCPYVALTRQSARNIMWPMLNELNDRFKISAVFTESNLTMTLPNGSRLQLFGADTKNFIARLKGIKTPGAAIDEAQDFRPHITELIDDVLGPATLDYTDGWIAVVGTPGAVPTGYFYDITHLGKYGYSNYGWSLFDNPYLPNPKHYVDELIKRKGWAPDNPTLLREYYGQWVMDLEALVIKYQAAHNHYDLEPQLSGHWSYIIGVDIGFHDADAIAVIGYHKHSRAAYLVEESVESEQGITELASKLDRLIRKYNPDRIVMDTGGLGKKIAEEMRKRYSLPIHAAEKTRKIEAIEIMNDALRTKKFFAKQDSLFADDSKRVKWDYEKSTPDKLVISDYFHSDIIDAVLYAFRESMHWLYEEPVVKPKPKTPEWFKEQEQMMEQAFIERMEEQNDNEGGFTSWGWEQDDQF